MFMLLAVFQTGYTKGWVGARLPCVKGGWQVSPGADCEWKVGAGAYYGAGQYVGMRLNTVTEGDDQAYVPLSGLFELKMYWCPVPENMDTCSKASGTFLVSGGIVKLDSGIPLREQSIVANNFYRGSPSAGGYCITLSHVDTGYEYRGNMGYGPDGRGIFCGDVYKLPVFPPKCSFNNGSNLDIQLGTLNRGDIAVKSGMTTPVSRELTINCVGNTSYNANMRLEYTPITVSNENVVSTSTNGLGVAVLYKGKAIQPGESFPLSYQPGINTLTLGFEAVRDPAMAVSDLKTGDFTANAVLVFTEQ
ncbi:MAG: fimbrial protein [Morganella sp. (in: enterobacteria)]